MATASRINEGIILHRARIISLLLAGSMLSGAHPLLSQGSVHSADRLCFRGHPAPACDGFWLTEFGLSARLTSTSYNEGPNRVRLTGALAHWELGWMVNQGARSAFGGGAFISISDEGTMFGVRPRYRRWLNAGTSLDIAPGVILSHPGNFPPGFSGQVVVNVRYWLSLSSIVQTVRMRSYRDSYNTGFPYVRVVTKNPVTAWFLGVQLGALPGVVTGFGFAALLRLYMAAVAD